MVSLTLKVILHVAENDSKYRDVHCSSFKVTSNANDIVDAELGLKKKKTLSRGSIILWQSGGLSHFGVSVCGYWHSYLSGGLRSRQ